MTVDNLLVIWTKNWKNCA